MKLYPSIPDRSGVPLGTPCLAFNKYDGSNLRFEFSAKTGWYKFGTRRRLFNESDPEYGSAIQVFRNGLAEPLADHFKRIKAERAMVFCEWVGPKSFAGQHAPDDTMELVLFDVNVHKKGFVSPHDFVRTFSPLVRTAEVLYEGPLSEDFVESVLAKPEGEGVICKGGSGHELWMCKIKTRAYLEKLKRVYGQHWKEHWE